jgi:hypothetical protein
MKVGAAMSLVSSRPEKMRLLSMHQLPLPAVGAVPAVWPYRQI